MTGIGVQDSDSQISPQTKKGDLRPGFDSKNYCHISDLLDPKLVNEVIELLKFVNFYEVKHPTGSIDLLSSPSPLTAMLNNALSTPTVLKQIQQITQLPESVTAFRGRFYKMSESQGNDVWHNDLVAPPKPVRLLGMSINFNETPYCEGNLLLRNCEFGQEDHTEIVNAHEGQALLFRIHPKLEHRRRQHVYTYPHNQDNYN